MAVPQKGSKSEQNSLSCTWYRPRPSETSNFRQRSVQNQKVAKAFLSVAILKISPTKYSLLGEELCCKNLPCLLWKFFQFSSTSYSQSISSLERLVFSILPYFKTLCWITYLYHAQHGWFFYVSVYSCNLLK